MLGYVLFSFLTLTNCSKNSSYEEQSYSQLQLQNKETSKRLIDQYHAKTFDCKEINSILNQKVILDSTIVGVIERSDGVYFKASIKNSCKQSIYAILKCSPEILDQYENLKSNHVFIVASISKVDNIRTISEIDSLDGKSNFVNDNNSILLTADCIAIEEIPIYHS